MSLNNIHIPTTISKVLSKGNWKQAMNIEMEALKKNRTWELVDLPIEKKNSLGCKWVYTIKNRANELLERYKPRLVAKGYNQTYGANYLETFALR